MSLFWNCTVYQSKFPVKIKIRIIKARKSIIILKGLNFPKIAYILSQN